MNHKIQLITIGLLLIGGFFTVIISLQAPAAFPEGTQFQVREGESLKSTSLRLEEAHIITSALFFRAWVSVLGKDKKIGLGTYTFDARIPMGLVIAKFAKGPDQPLFSVTIPEGYTTPEIASAFKKVIPGLDEGIFIQKVGDEKLNGYLFPATYYPLPSFSEEDIIARMKTAFDKQYAAAFESPTFPPHVPTQQAVVTLASVLEGEAKTEEDMKIVSGILQKRLANGMRLQVDAAPETYTKTGLPKEPIDNPGIVAMKAVFFPTPTAYLYYLTGKDGTMHYAKTFEEHKKNIARYLR